MSKPGEHKTVQARILAYAQEIGWSFVSREEAERRRGFDPEVPPADRARNRSLFFDDLLDAKVREFNPRYADAEGALLGQFRHLHTDIYGNREFVDHLRNPPSPEGYGGTGRGKFFDQEENRESDFFRALFATVPLRFATNKRENVAKRRIRDRKMYFFLS